MAKNIVLVVSKTIVARSEQISMSDSDLEVLCDQIVDQIDLGLDAIINHMKNKFPNVQFTAE